MCAQEQEPLDNVHAPKTRAPRLGISATIQIALLKCAFPRSGACRRGDDEAPSTARPSRRRFAPRFPQPRRRDQRHAEIRRMVAMQPRPAYTACNRYILSRHRVISNPDAGRCFAACFAGSGESIISTSRTDCTSCRRAVLVLAKLGLADAPA